MIRLARLLVLCSLAACELPAPGPVSGTFPLEVGPAGGVIEGLAGTELEGVRLEIPAGALTQPVTIDATFNDEEPELAAGSFFVGPSFQFSPRAQTFAKPVTLRMPVATQRLASFEQTTETCLMWLRGADASWSQAVPVAHTDDSVTAETSTLVQAAVGVKSQLITAPPHPLTLPCTNPAGFCVDVNPERLKPGNLGWSEVNDVRKLLYRRTETDAGVTRVWVSEYDLVTGRHGWESQPFVPPATTPTNFAIGITPTLTVARGGDDAGWTPVAHGLVKFPLAGAPSLLPDSVATGRTMGVVFTADGRRHRQLISVGGGTVTMRLATATGANEAAAVQVESTSGLFSGAEFPFFRMPGGAKLGWLWREPAPRVHEANPPASSSALPLHPDVDEFQSRAGVDSVRVSDDGSMVAAITFGFPANLYVQSRDGSVSRAFSGLPRLETVEFGEPGFLYAAPSSAAHVYRVELATGAIQTIELTSSTDPAVIVTRVPHALRHVVLPATATTPVRHLIYVIAGTSSARSVLLIRPAQ